MDKWANKWKSVLFILSFIAGLISNYAILGYRVTDLEKKVTDRAALDEVIITKLENIRNDVTELKTDMRWLKGQLGSKEHNEKSALDTVIPPRGDSSRLEQLGGQRTGTQAAIPTSGQ